jgi:hypothetical protein
MKIAAFVLSALLFAPAIAAAKVGPTSPAKPSQVSAPQGQQFAYKVCRKVGSAIYCV